MATIFEEGDVKLKIPVECYSRVVGYFRPTSQWNKGKQEEFRERKNYDVSGVKYEPEDKSCGG